MIDKLILREAVLILVMISFWILCGCESESANGNEAELVDVADDATIPLEVGEHLFKIGNDHFCGVIVSKEGFDLLVYDNFGNDFGITQKNEDLRISQTRVEGATRIIIIDKEGDGLPDLRAIYSIEGNFVSKENLEVSVKGPR